MAFARQYTQREIDYIAAHWKSKSAAEMAAELGRSERGVYKKIRDMHLRDDEPPKPPEPMHTTPRRGRSVQPKKGRTAGECIGGAMSDRERLAGLRDLIWAALEQATPADVSRLAPEYRKTISEMERMDAEEGRPDREDAAGPGGQLAKVLSL